MEPKEGERKIKYLTCLNKLNQCIKDCLNEIPRRGGYYNWLFLHRGEIEAYQYVKDFNEYDVVQVNMSPADQEIVPLIRQKITNPNTKLVLNNDHVSEIWGSFEQAPQRYLEIQKMGDMVFGTEEHQVSSMIDGAFCIPHPHWIEFYKHIDRSKVEKGTIGIINHWWHGDTFIPAQVIHRLKEQLGPGKIKAKIFAWRPEYDKNQRWSRTFFDEFIGMLDYPDYLRELSKCEVIYEPCPYHTYGRNSVDGAIMGIPFVGSDRPDSMRRCFPNLSCDPYNTKQIIRNILKVMEGGEWLEAQMSIARRKAEYYSYKEAEKRFMRALEIQDQIKKGVIKKPDGHWRWNEEINDFEVY